MGGVDKYWNEMSAEQKYEIEKEWLRNKNEEEMRNFELEEKRIGLELERLERENGLSREDRVRIAKHKITRVSLVFLIPFVILALGYGIARVVGVCRIAMYS